MRLVSELHTRNMIEIIVPQTAMIALVAEQTQLREGCIRHIMNQWEAFTVRYRHNITHQCQWEGCGTMGHLIVDA